jgi:hypothetical protein
VDLTRKLWAAIQGDPVFMRRVNGWLAVFWVAMIPVSYELGWLKSVAYVSALSPAKPEPYNGEEDSEQGSPTSNQP